MISNNQKEAIKDRVEALMSKHRGEIITVEDAFEGNFMDIKQAKIKLSNGSMITREQVTKNNNNSDVVYILPVTTSEEVLLTIQSRPFSKSGVGIDIPAGFVDSSETASVAASRELHEETGYTSNKLIQVAEYYQDIGCCDANITCYLALDSIRTREQKLDCDEYIDTILVSVSELEYLISSGYIKSAPALLTLNAYKNMRGANMSRKELTALYGIAAEDERYYNGLFQSRMSFCVGILTAAISATAAFFAAFYGSVSTALLLFIGGFLTLCTFLICQTCKKALKRAYRRFLEAIAYRAKLESMLGLARPVKSLTNESVGRWKNDKLIIERHLDTRKNFESSTLFVDEMLEHGVNKYMRDAFSWIGIASIGFTALFWLLALDLLFFGYWRSIFSF